MKRKIESFKYVSHNKLGMAEPTAFRGIIEFFDKIGVFDVVLPFLLVFTIVFAILEKTKVLGTDEINGKQYTKKNLNAMTAFVMSFFVVASSKLVEILTQVSAQMVILLMLSVLFLLLVGSFQREGEPTFLSGNWRWFFMLIMFVGIIAIFLNAIGWLDEFWDFVSGTGSAGEAVGSIVLIVIIILFMIYAVRGHVGEEKTHKETAHH